MAKVPAFLSRIKLNSSLLSVVLAVVIMLEGVVIAAMARQVDYVKNWGTGLYQSTVALIGVQLLVLGILVLLCVIVNGEFLGKMGVVSKVRSKLFRDRAWLFPVFTWAPVMIGVIVAIEGLVAAYYASPMKVSGLGDITGMWLAAFGAQLFFVGSALTAVRLFDHRLDTPTLVRTTVLLLFVSFGVLIYGLAAKASITGIGGVKEGTVELLGLQMELVALAALVMTGAILLYYPGTSPGGSAGNAVVGDNTPSDVTAGSGTTNTVSNEQTSGCPEETTSCPEEEAGCPDQQDVSALTSLAVCKCATGFWERATIYDWTVEKSILQTDGVEVSEDGSYAFAELASGETVTVHYQIAAERVVASESDVMGVSGYVRVTNTGLWPTENLKIVDHVQSSNGCGYEDVAVFNVDTSAHPVLCPGESYCYTYEHEFEAEAGACYLNLAVATITNMEPSCDGAGVSACARFSMPSEPTVTVVDESARLVEELQCPAGFECVPDVTGPWTLTGSKTLFVNVTVTNVDAPCGESFDLVNFANLTELDTCQKHSDSAVVELGYACEEDQSTTIAVEKTIDGSWTRGGGYTWGVEKIVTPNTVTLAQGETAQVTYVITVTRTPGSITDDVRVFGTVTVTNTGGNSTDGLAVLDTLYVSIDGTEHLLASKDISVSAKPVLAAGESYTYDYSFDVTNDVLALLQGPPMLASPMDLQTPGQGLLTELSFRNVASANITNYEGHEGSAFAVTDEATHVISGPPELTDIDEQAILEDVFGTLPAGFTVSNMRGCSTAWPTPPTMC